MTWIAVLIGGAAGSAARHAVNLAAPRVFGTATPYATTTVNLLGSFVIGIIAGALASGRITLTTPARAFVFTGLLGGFTTFSSLMLDTLVLNQAGDVTKSAANLIGQIVVGLLLIYLGWRIGSN